MTTRPMAVPNATARSSVCSGPMRKRPRAGACTRKGEDAPQQTTKQEPDENRAHRRARLLAHDVVLLLFRLQDHEQTGSMTISRTAMWIGEKIVGSPVRNGRCNCMLSGSAASDLPSIFFKGGRHCTGDTLRLLTFDDEHRRRGLNTTLKFRHEMPPIKSRLDWWQKLNEDRAGSF